MEDFLLWLLPLMAALWTGYCVGRMHGTREHLKSLRRIREVIERDREFVEPKLWADRN